MAYDDDEWSLAEAYAEAGDDLIGKIYPSGQYTGQVVKMEPKTTAGGKRAFVVSLKFTKGPLKDKTVTTQMTWSPESDVAMRIFAQGLTVLGADQNWIKTTKPSMRQIADRCLGAEVEMTLSEKEFGGSPRNDVRFDKNLSKGGSNGSPANKPLADDLAEDAEDLTPANSGAGVSGLSGDDDAGLNWP